MKFERPQDVQDVLTAGDQVELTRSENRVKVDNLANGYPPLTDDEAKKMNIKVNVNWNEAANLFAQAKRQYVNAVTLPNQYFKVTIPKAPPEYRSEWEAWITQFINGVMKKSSDYYYYNEDRFSSLVNHGIAPGIRYNREDWCPSYKALGDLRVPTDTLTSMKNLGWFGSREYYTPGELVRKAWGKNADPGWNKPALAKILDEYKDLNWLDSAYNWLDNPEMVAELVKQNLGYFTSDAMPTIPVWNFYYQDDKDGVKCDWKRYAVPVQGQIRGDPHDDQFLYTSKKPCGKELSEILHVQFGDLNSVSPHKYQSVRGLGFMLMEPCFWSNLTLCRGIQHLFENFNTWFRSTDPAGKARAQAIQTFDRCILPEGVSIVPQAERHQIDPNLLELISARVRQLQSEQSASYTQQADTGTQKEQTAYETHVKMAMVNAMMQGILGSFFFKETFDYRETCRRFCLSDSQNADARRFIKEATEFGIPRVWLNVNLWEVEPVLPPGWGNPTMALAEVNQLMGQREKFAPEAQQEILHDFVAVTTNDARKAARLVPLGQRRSGTPGQLAAESAFAVCMHGVPPNIQENVSPIEQIETMLGLMAGVIARLERQTNLATPSELAGLNTCVQYTATLIQVLAGNKAEKQRVKQYSDALGKLVNALKGFAQRMQEQNAATNGNGNGESAELQGKIHAKTIETQAKVKLAEMKAQQQQDHKERAFRADERRKDAQAFAEIQRQSVKNKLTTFQNGQDGSPE